MFVPLKDPATTSADEALAWRVAGAFEGLSPRLHALRVDPGSRRLPLPGHRAFVLYERRPARPNAADRIESRARREGFEVMSYTAAILAPDGRPYGATGAVPASPDPGENEGRIVADAFRRAGLGAASRHGTVSTALRRLGLVPLDEDILPPAHDAGTPNVAVTAARISAATRLPCGLVSSTLERILDARGLAPIREAVHPMAARALRRQKDYDSKLYAYYAEPGTVGHRRRLVADAFPSFADVVRSPQMARVLEEALPLGAGFGAFARGVPASGAPPLSSGHLRAMRRASWRDLGLETKRQLLLMLSEMPSNWFPESAEEALAARDLLPLHDDLRRLVGDPSPAFAEMGGRWAAFRDRIATVSGLKPAQFRILPHLMHDAASDIAKRVVLPCVAHVRGEPPGTGYDPRDAVRLLEPAVSRLLFAGRGLPACIETQELWHRRRGIGGHAGDGLPMAWPAMTQPWTSSSGIVAVPLTSRQALVDEGNALSHCVGTYAYACYIGASQIVSLRAMTSQGPVPLATAEIDIAGSRPSVRQHQGPHNRPPCAEAAEALREYLDAIAEGRLALSPDALALRQATRLRNMPTLDLEQVCGFDWRDPHALRAVIAAYDPVLPRGLRRLPPEEWDALARRQLPPEEYDCLLAPDPEFSGPAEEFDLVPY